MVNFNTAVDLRTRQIGVTKEEDKLLKKELFPPDDFLTAISHEDPDLHRIGESLPVPTTVKANGALSIGKSSVPAREDHTHPTYDSNGNVNLITNGSGGMFVNGRTFYGLNWAQTLFGAAQNPMNAYAAFMVNGISITTYQSKTDLIRVTLGGIFQSTAAGAIFRSNFQIFGPGGNTILNAGGGGFALLANGEYVNFTQSMWYNPALGDGSYNYTVIGGMQAGTGILYDPYLTLEQFIVR